MVTGGAGSSPTGSAATIGEEANGVGALTVTDPGSLLLLSGHLNVGLGSNGVNTINGGTGTLNIVNGGVVSDINGYVGRYAGSAGVASVSGNNSGWLNSGSLFISANSSASNSGGAALGADGDSHHRRGRFGLGITSAVIGAAGVLNLQGTSFASPAITDNGLIIGSGSLFGPIAGSGTVQATGALTTDSVRIRVDRDHHQRLADHPQQQRLQQNQFALSGPQQLGNRGQLFKHSAIEQQSPDRADGGLQQQGVGDSGDQ